MAATRRTSAGFTLAELAIALAIIVIVLAGLLVPLSAQIDARNSGDTQKTLVDVRDALLGFAAANGRIPCPASATSNGFESPVAGGICTNPFDGFVPAATLGIAPTDNQGYAVDGWGNRLRYAVSRDPTSKTMSSNASGPWRDSFTTTGGVRTTTMGALNPDLHVCNAGPATGARQCTSASRTNSAVAVVFSLGKNASTGGGGTDEAENLNADRVFVFHEPAATGSPAGEFDDVLTWLSPNILYNRLIAAGQLP